ncbi:nitrous oxide reductase accessory protein NosL [Halobacterium wangiae]|uniref:nitrous oxide reductase accessory protein NosL n=1 Tax=Halobacterium wangiae TaxID=2902623 RepID=UPI001E3B4E7B|nr:nitrous oxide reductase accessory protein NosL [Halobacterium wangiae]
MTRHTNRRAFLATGAAALTTALAGCTVLGGASGDQEAGPKPDPVDLSGGKADDQGGMLIGEHFGPNGQIFYADHSPEGHDNPAWFHTLAVGLFPYHFAREQQGWTADAIYVTDYSTVDYDLTERKGRQYITSHTAADTFGDAEALTYVAGSRVHGGMGTELLPFSDDSDASEFVSTHGGETVAFDDIDREFLQSSR